MLPAFRFYAIFYKQLVYKQLELAIWKNIKQLGFWTNANINNSILYYEITSSKKHSSVYNLILNHILSFIHNNTEI